MRHISAIPLELKQFMGRTWEGLADEQKLALEPDRASLGDCRIHQFPGAAPMRPQASSLVSPGCIISFDISFKILPDRFAASMTNFAPLAESGAALAKNLGGPVTAEAHMAVQMLRTISAAGSWALARIPS